MNKRQIVIGDIHGCAKTFSELIANKCQITKDDKVYLLGDYIDRGPDSKKVVQTILDMIDDGYDLNPIMGNHEQMLLESLNSFENLLAWLRNGAEYTLKSFNAEAPEEIETRYLDFFKALPYFHKLEDYIIVHGGLNFNIADPLSDIFSMVWERNTEIDKDKIGGRRLIVGHTPRNMSQIIDSLNTDKIMLDGGCVYHKMFNGDGYLCALELNTMQLFAQINIDF